MANVLLEAATLEDLRAAINQLQEQCRKAEHRALEAAQVARLLAAKCRRVQAAIQRAAGGRTPDEVMSGFHITKSSG